VTAPAAARAARAPEPTFAPGRAPDLAELPAEALDGLSDAQLRAVAWKAGLRGRGDRDGLLAELRAALADLVGCPGCGYALRVRRRSAYTVDGDCLRCGTAGRRWEFRDVRLPAMEDLKSRIAELLAGERTPAGTVGCKPPPPTVYQIAGRLGVERVRDVGLALEALVAEGRAIQTGHGWAVPGEHRPRGPRFHRGPDGAWPLNPAPNAGKDAGKP